MHVWAESPANGRWRNIHTLVCHEDVGESRVTERVAICEVDPHKHMLAIQTKWNVFVMDYETEMELMRIPISGIPYVEYRICSLPNTNTLLLWPTRVQKPCWFSSAEDEEQAKSPQLHARLFDPHTGTLLRSFPLPSNSPKSGNVRLPFVVLPNGQVACINPQCTISLWDVHSGKSWVESDQHVESSVESLLFDEENSGLVSVVGEKSKVMIRGEYDTQVTIRVWK